MRFAARLVLLWIDVGDVEGRRGCEEEEEAERTTKATERKPLRYFLNDFFIFNFVCLNF